MWHNFQTPLDSLGWTTKTLHIDCIRSELGYISGGSIGWNADKTHGHKNTRNRNGNVLHLHVDFEIYCASRGPPYDSAALVNKSIAIRECLYLTIKALLIDDSFVQRDKPIYFNFVELQRNQRTDYYSTAIQVRHLFYIISGIEIALCLPIVLTVTTDDIGSLFVGLAFSC